MYEEGREGRREGGWEKVEHRGLLLASLSINLVCGFMLATMTGTKKEGREGGRGEMERSVARLVVH